MGASKEKECVPGPPFLQESNYQSNGFFGHFRLLEASGKAGDISDKPVICKNQRPAGKSSLNGNQDIVTIDGKVFVLDLL